MIYLESILNAIKSKAKSGIHPGLESIGALCNELLNVQDNLKFVHVAGTNGKGSVCSFCESILAQSGIKVGCYTSPCVFEKLEQFRINSINCTEDIFNESAKEVLRAVDKLNEKGIFPSEFEIETAIAFLIFYREECDICIIECGMGGRYDATNIIKNTLLSVLAPIAFDHSAYLGENITQIAHNKCGIIKENAFVVSANQNDEVMQVVMNQCGIFDNHRYFIDTYDISQIEFSDSEMSFKYKNTQYKSRLLGLHQAENASLAIEIAEFLAKSGYYISKDDIKNGILNAKNNGRFEILSEKPLVICDGAHNPHGAASLVESLKAFFPETKFTVVMGVFKDKEYEKILEIISKIGDDFFGIALSGERGLDGKILIENAARYFKNANLSSIEDVCGYIEESDKAFCVCGSLSYLNSFRKCYKERENG